MTIIDDASSSGHRIRATANVVNWHTI